MSKAHRIVGKKNTRFRSQVSGGGYCSYEEWTRRQKERNQVPYKPVEQKPYLSSLQKSAPIGAVTPRKSIDDILKGAKSSFLDKSTTDVATSNSNLKSGYKIGPHATRAYVKMFSVWEAKYEEKVVIPDFFRIAACIGNNWKPLSYHVKTGVFPEHEFADKLYSSYNAAVADAMELANRYRARFYDATRRLQTAKVALKPSLWAEPEKSVAISNSPTDGIQTLDWDGKFNLSYTAPQVFIYRGKSYPYFKSWQDVYFMFLALIIHEHPNRFDDGMQFLKNGKCVDLSNEKYKDNLRYPKHIKGTDYWAESNLSASGMALRMKYLLDYCYIHYSNVVIKYSLKEKDEVERRGRTREEILEEQRAQKEADEKAVEDFRKIVAEEFPNGCVWTNTTITHIQSKTADEFSPLMQKYFKRFMFQRKDGVYLLPESIADDNLLNTISGKCDLLIREAGCFSLETIWTEFQDCFRNLNEDDFVRFCEEFVLSKMNENCTLVRRKHRAICVRNGTNEESVFREIADKVREFMLDAGDAVDMETILAAHPHLSVKTIEYAIKEFCADVVEVKQDEMVYYKLLEHFYLPKEFKTIAEETIQSTEANGKSTSLALFDAAFGEAFGYTYKDDYAIWDDELLKDVISISLRKDDYAWKHDLFVNTKTKKANLADEFLATQTGVFHEDDFFAYAAEQRGFDNKAKATLICQYLRPKCIRLNQTLWIAVNDFKKASSLSDENRDHIKRELLQRSINLPFLSIGNLPEAFYSIFTPIDIEDTVYYWNEYMLTSVVENLIPEIRIVNTEPSPYIVTALIIPENIVFSGDVLHYILDYLWVAHREKFSQEDAVFNYLKDNKIRVSKTQKLLARIVEFRSAHDV